MLLGFDAALACCGGWPGRAARVGAAGGHEGWAGCGDPGPPRRASGAGQEGAGGGRGGAGAGPVGGGGVGGGGERWRGGGRAKTGKGGVRGGIGWGGRIRAV